MFMAVPNIIVNDRETWNVLNVFYLSTYCEPLNMCMFNEPLNIHMFVFTDVCIHRCLYSLEVAPDELCNCGCECIFSVSSLNTV